MLWRLGCFGGLVDIVASPRSIDFPDRLRVTPEATTVADGQPVRPVPVAESRSFGCHDDRSVEERGLNVLAAART
jgi:hypothetical protein